MARPWTEVGVGVGSRMAQFVANRCHTPFWFIVVMILQDFPCRWFAGIKARHKDESSKTPFAMHQLSEGSLRFLWLATLLHSPELSAVTMIDEPEVSLHPELLSLLADLLREASQRTQIVVATHADRLVRFLDPSEVLTVNVSEEGAAEFLWADQLDLASWLDEYTLDEVWRMGRMGARP